MPGICYNYPMAEFHLDFDDKKLMRGFVDIEKAQVIAAKNTLNTMAFLTRKNAQREISTEFINRNTFTQRQIQVDKADGLRLADLESHVGATEKADYMELQELGGTREPSGSGKSLAIPTDEARGGSKTRPVTKADYLRRVKAKSVQGPHKRPGSFRSKLIASAAVAAKKGKYLNYHTGIYRVISFKDGQFKLEMIYNTKEKSVPIKETPWLMPSTRQPIRDSQSIYDSQVRKLLRGKVF